MATFLRQWSYRYPWLYRGISQVSTFPLGGSAAVWRLPLRGLPIHSGHHLLDLCCGLGDTTQVLLDSGAQVTGLDASPKSLAMARQTAPAATYVQAMAQAMPFADGTFDGVYSSMALHEFSPEGLLDTLREVHRILKPGGWLALLDFHPPQQVLLWPGLTVFFGLFETETAWAWIHQDPIGLLQDLGFGACHRELWLGGSLQVLQTYRPPSTPET